MIKRILVGLSGSRFGDVAIRRAVELARIHDAELTAVTVVDSSQLQTVGAVPVGAGALAKELREHRIVVTYDRVERSVEEFRSACAVAGVRHKVVCEDGDPFSEMIAFSRYHDLMVFGLRGIFEYGFVETPSDTLARLITDGVRPVLAVSEMFRPVRRVLVAYSGSVESAKTMRQFVSMRLWPDITLRIVTFEHPEEEARTLLAEAADYCRAHGLEPEMEYSPHPASQELLLHASAWEADLIVLGSSARSLLMRRLFGDTALHAIQNANRPLFLA